MAVPDALIAQDATLLQQADVFAGPHDDGSVLINFAADVRTLGLDEFAAARARGSRAG